MAKSRDRKRFPARKLPFLEAKPRILIVCEGKFTEPDYINGFAKSARNPRVTIEVIPEIGVPLSVVRFAKIRKEAADKEAAKEQDENLKFDSVWALFDVDEHPGIPEAIQIARDNSIRLAVSNPCFELWLLLHFRDHPGQKHRSHVTGLLGNFVKGYNKRVNYQHFQAGYSEAVRRAGRLESCNLVACRAGPNPSTEVHFLTETIRTK